MCKCNPSVRTPFCGKLGCEWTEQRVKIKFKDWVFVQLDSGHWVGEYGLKSSPIFAYKSHCVIWVKNYINMSKQKIKEKS